MNIVICGAGEVGRHAAEVLVDDNSVTIIDQDPAKLLALEDTMDVRVLHGNGTHADVLREAGCGSADLFIAATRSDETNLLAASIATGVGAARSIARVHHSAYFEGRGMDYAHHFGIDHLVCPEYTTALAIAQVLRSPGALAVERFARGKIEMQQLPVTSVSPAVGKPLAKLGLPRSTKLAMVERGEASFIPDAGTVLAAGDVATLVGETESFEKARRIIHGEANGRKRIMIMGGSPLAVWLCRALRGRMFSVRLFEWDRARAEELAAKLDWVTVLRVDPMDADTLMLERIDQSDAFVTVTSDDERNVLAAARAKSMGAKMVISVLQRSTYLHLLEHVGIDKAFSPRATAVAEIQRILDDSPMRRLASLSEGVAEVFELRVPRGAPVVGVELAQLQLPGHSLIAAIQRGEEVHVPGAQDDVEPGDTAIVIAPAASRAELAKLFGVK